MRVALLMLAAAGIISAAPMQAQTEQAQSALEIGPFTPATPIAVEPNATSMQMPWAYRFANAATAAAAFPATKTSIGWALVCKDAKVTLDAPATEIQFEAGKTDYAGTAMLAVRASRDTVGVVPIACTLDARTPAKPGLLPANATLAFDWSVAFVPGLRVQAEVDHKTSGPQKQIYYPIEVQNLGNSRTRMLFEMVQKPHGKWNAILPAQVVLDPGQSVTTTFTVATPFGQGYNSDEATYIVRVTPLSVEKTPQRGAPVDTPLHASASGWYVPAPSPALFLVGLAAIAARRSAR